MGEKTMQELERIFKRAKEINQKYVAVIIDMEGFPKPEMIVNPMENMETKLEYYKKTYDENLNHKFAKGIKIIWFTFGSTFEELEDDYRAYCGE